MAILNKKNKAALFNPLSKDNPVIVQVLGICSCLAVTAKLEPAIVMGISVTAVTAFSNVIISLIRNDHQLDDNSDAVWNSVADK